MTNLQSNTRYALLIYDIPANLRLGNLSMLLRRFGARINLSCWVLPLKNLALVPIKMWVEKGAKVEVVEFDEHESEKVIALARRAIQNDLEQTRGFVEGSVSKVRARFADTMTLGTNTQERIEAQKKAEGYSYAVLYRAKAIADAAEEAALHFDLTGDVAELVEALRRSIKAKSTLFFHLQREARTGTQGPAMRGLPLPEAQGIMEGVIQ